MRPAEAPTAGAKKTRAKRKPRNDQFIVLSEKGDTVVVPTKELLETVKSSPNCKVFTIGKMVKGITVIPGKQNVLTGETAEEKVVVKY